MIEKSVALTAQTNHRLQDHLIRGDGQEDVCLASYRLSTGTGRRTAVIQDFFLPAAADRQVHGNVTISGDFVCKSAERARETDCGLVMLHSHPAAHGWQTMSTPDRDTEASFGNLVLAITQLPLVGMTLAGNDRSWSARHWDIGAGTHIAHSDCINVRVVGDRLSVDWNNSMAPIPIPNHRQKRTISAWGEATQADLSRLRVLIVGAGSVGLDLALRLVATGLTNITIMDFDIVQMHNLDRMIGATPRDARLLRYKTHISKRECNKAATASQLKLFTTEQSVCEPAGFKEALNADIIFSCVDRDWPRMVLNKLAYTDLIPVIDGGIAIRTKQDGKFSGAAWRAHVVRPGSPCLVCLEQLEVGMAALDQGGDLDNPAYILNVPHLDPEANAQNVASLSVSVTSSLLLQFIGFCATTGALVQSSDFVQPIDQFLTPGGSVVRYDRDLQLASQCLYEPDIAGDSRERTWVKDHPLAQSMRSQATEVSARIKALRIVDNAVSRLVASWYRIGAGA